MEPILEFKDAARFLSNFATGNPVTLDGVEYDQTENAYQAAKTLDKDIRKQFQHCTPGLAKKMGQRIPMRPDWEEVKIPIMADLVWQKFSKHPELRDKLLATGDAELVEGNYWGDVFWGACAAKPTAGIALADGETGSQLVGENWLGKILMEVRSQLASPAEQKA